MVRIVESFYTFYNKSTMGNEKLEMHLGLMTIDGSITSFLSFKFGIMLITYFFLQYYIGYYIKSNN